MEPTDFVHALTRVRWDIARRTYGSSHATLIGLMAQWWIELQDGHTVLDGAPSFGGRNDGNCDLLLCAADRPTCVVEVEGTDPIKKLGTIGRYFASVRPELGGISTGLLLTYAYFVRGRGASRAYPPAERLDVTAKALQVSAAFPDRCVILIGLDKSVDEPRSPLRDSSEYYWGSAAKASAVLMQGGAEIRREVLFQAAPGI